MKKLLYLLLTVCVVLEAAAPALVLAQTTPIPTCTTCNLPYTPLEPIPGFTVNSNGTSFTDSNSFYLIVDAIFKVFITVGALFAVFMLTVGGIQYMVSGGPADKARGIQRAKAALWGIVLISASWLILYTINPALINFNLNPCPTGAAGCTINGTTGTVQNTNTGTAAASPISGLPVDQAGCSSVNGAQTVSGLLSNISSFWYGLNSTVKTAFSNQTYAQQAQMEQAYLAACAQAKLI